MGLGFASSWRPLLPFNSVNQSVHSGEALTLHGWRFRGLSGASGGTTTDSPTDYPLVQFRRLDNDRIYWLLANPSFSFSSTSFVSAPLGSFPNGPYLVTVFVNGISSNFSRLTQFSRTGLSAVAQLLAQVEALHLHNVSLVAKLHSARQSLEKENIIPARNNLNAFINEVRALKGKKILAREADILMDDAQDILAMLQ